MVSKHVFLYLCLWLKKVKIIHVTRKVIKTTYIIRIIILSYKRLKTYFQTSARKIFALLE